METKDKTLEQERMLQAILNLPTKKDSKEIDYNYIDKKFISDHIEFVVIK